MNNKGAEVFIIGGPDVNARIALMQHMGKLQIVAAGSKSDLRDEFSQAGFDYFYYPLDRGTNPIADIFTFFSLLRLYTRLRPDIVHAFDTKPCVWGRLAAALARVPVVIGTIPGLGKLYTKKNFKNRLLRFVYQPLQKLACAVSDLTIFQNQDDFDFFTTAGIVAAQKASVIPGSGVNTDQFSPSGVIQQQARTFRHELGISEERVVVTMISRLIRTKGVLEFANAAQEIRSFDDKITFLLVGPEDRESIDRLTPDEMEQVKEKVNWIGVRDDIPVVLAASDIFVLPTYYREGIPRVLLEAASMELPLVATDMPGCREVVQDGDNGFLVPPKDNESLVAAISKMVDDPGLRRRFGKQSRQRVVKHFDLTLIAEQTKNTYRRLLSENG